MSSDSNWLTVGRFGRVHGIRGFITVHSFTDPASNFLDYANWHALIGGVFLAIEVLELTHHGDRILMKVKGYETREKAMQLTGIDIAVLKESLPSLSEGEYYWHEIMNLEVKHFATGQSLGFVTDIFETGANDVLVVTGDKKRLIPLRLQHTVIEVNLASGYLTVDWDPDF